MKLMREPNCYKRKCKHFIGVKNFGEQIEQDERVICKAFPQGIPDVIGYGPRLHTTPFPGDHGIQYEKNENEE